MRSFLLLACAAVLAIPALSFADKDKDKTPAKKELFSKEDWYKELTAKERSFQGVLQKKKGDGGIGIVQRFNPYFLVIKTKDGEVKRDVYVGGKNTLLDAFVGKKVKFTGKPWDQELEGRQLHEIWPASIERVEEKKEE